MCKQPILDRTADRLIKSVAFYSFSGIAAKAGLDVWGCVDGCVGRSAVGIAWAAALAMFLFGIVLTFVAVLDALEKGTISASDRTKKIAPLLVTFASAIVSIATILVIWDSWSL